ncbi:transcription initiation factor IIA, gamma subunit, helical domain-containing protein [Fimicolochytrium jonesii]|uniref:transcription initiation factor IIA, gamma subunit, helical domain-containing protein n=1 Tax=Fimicolochytrium jonesii TaxID=1396493 RepID=UPI0022FE8A01|nr:transcription initiation factor IIA, gamma subunit, helical domain-containing protein [Fimicolochytrium jonesii]KAI8815948.1 transcription initiation factor IIA, gamma subunit, helical domain-containing protein [Fimicolochytrium jonesii]
MATQYELYRRSSLGLALTDTLDDLIQEGHLDPQVAIKVLQQFDVTIGEALHSKVRAKTHIKGHLREYRFCDDVWTFVVDRPTFKLDGGDILEAERVKFVACSARGPGTAPSSQA